MNIAKPILFTLLLGSLSAMAGERSMNDAWKFIREDVAGAEQVAFDDAAWRTISVPHDWSIEGEYAEDNPMGDRCGYLPAGIGWYRKTVPVSRDWKGKQVELAFDGVFMNSTVWVNGKKLGTRPYGWVSFGYDVSDAVASSDTLTIAVRVDNDKQPSARWYTGSGIYADTWLRIREPVYVPTSGIFVRTENNSDVLVETEVANKTRKAVAGELVSTVLNPSGGVLASHSEPFKIKPDSQELVKQTIPLQDPALWSIEDPNLHTLVTRVKVGGKTMDTVETRFGVRDIQWVPETGMWLNGRNIKLQGVCIHNDAGAMGVAVPNKILRYRIQQMKDMGANAFRTGHQAQTPRFYEMCDEIGMLVMDEFFDGWMKKADHDYGAHAFDEWWKRDLEALIKRDRNHPSVVLYSVGNETHGDVGKEMVDFCHCLDDTRPVTSGNAEPQDMDVYGVNGGSEAKTFFDDLDTGGKVFIGSENPHTWHTRGFYRTQMWYRDGYMGKNNSGRAHYYPNLTMDEIFTYDWTDGSDRTHVRQTLRSEYDNSTISITARHNIQKLRDIPAFAGSFRWTGFDYLGEARYHGGWPFKSFSGGTVDLANFEKDIYYLYQSQWTHEPMIHILPHWTHPTLAPGTEIPVWVYSNCDEVELFLNGKSLGKQKPGKRHTDMQCDWMVGWKPGELKAVGYIDGLPVREETMRTANAPSQLELSVDGDPLANAVRDIVQVRVAAADDKGTFYPYGENRTWFHVIGSGKIRALDNGSPLDVEKYFEAESRIGFFGLTRAYIESTDADGDVALLASSILGEKKQVTSNKVSIDTKLLVLRGGFPEVDVKVYYTTDGSDPTKASARYSKPFEVALGTTVKALVVLNGKPVHLMKERFAKDEGFVFHTLKNVEAASGEQAEKAKISGAKISKDGSGFNGRGFVEFDATPESGFVEFYYENDRAAGDFDLSIRYSSSRKKTLTLSVNDEPQEVAFSPSKKYRKSWKLYTFSHRLQAGANYIKLSADRNLEGLCIDELIIK